MPKATITFKLPEENEEYAIYSKAQDFLNALYDIKNYFRGLYKYESKESLTSEEVYEAVCDILNEYGIEV